MLPSRRQRNPNLFWQDCSVSQLQRYAFFLRFRLFAGASAAFPLPLGVTASSTRARSTCFSAVSSSCCLTFNISAKSSLCSAVNLSNLMSLRARTRDIAPPLTQCHFEVLNITHDAECHV